MKLYHMDRIDEERNLKKYDILICANGLEARDARAAEIFLASSCVSKWVIFSYSEREKNDDLFLGNISKKCCEENIVEIKTSYQDAETYERLLGDVSEDIGPDKQIGIDITGFKNQFFFPLIRYLKEVRGIDLIDVYYTEPATYKFPEAGRHRTPFPNMIKSQNLLFKYSKAESGIEIKSIPGFAGVHAKETILVLVLGFDGKVAVRIREEYSAGQVVLINGFPSYLPKFRDISLLNNKELVNSCEKEDIYSTYSDNPFEIYNLLCKINKRFQSCKLLIAPLGAKPLALGICKFAIDHPKTAVLYVESQIYNEKSTDEYGVTWRYLMEF